MNPLRQKMLVVDDDHACREALVEFFRREGFSVCIASNGKEAFEVIRTQHVDLSVMDVHMPGMTGPEVLQRVLAEAGALGVPPTVLISSDRSAEALARQLFECPVDFLPKPVRLEALRQTVQQLLRSQDHLP